MLPESLQLDDGQYGQRFGKYGMSRGLPIPSDRPTIANFLHGEGYATGQIGKWDIGTREQGPLVSGFTEVARNPPRKTYTKKEIADLPPLGSSGQTQRSQVQVFLRQQIR